MFKEKYIKTYKMSNAIEIPFTEQANLSKARVLNALDNEVLKKVVFLNHHKHEDTIIFNVKKYLLKLTLMNGSISRTYELKNGNFTSNGYGISDLPNNLRNYLFDDYNFFEMRNIDIYIITRIAKQFYELETPNCQNYLDAKIGCDEFYIDQILTKDKKEAVAPSIEGLQDEISNIKDILYNQTPEAFDEIEVRDDKYNRLSRNMKDIIEYIKYNNFFPTIIKCFKSKNIAGFTKNGFVLRNEIEEQDVLTKLYSETGDKGWKINEEKCDLKHITEKLEQSAGYEVTDSYASQKEKFEMEHFIIENPLIYCRERQGQDGLSNIAMYKKNEFIDIVSPWQHMEVKKNGDTVYSSLFRKWIQDETRRSYEMLDFIPDKNYKNDRIYNTFKGFDYDDYDRGYNKKEWVIEFFKKHLLLLVDNDQKAMEYVLNFIAHIFQKPYELPGVCLLFRSIEGMGKDGMLEIIQKLLGKEYVAGTSNLNEVFGDFNGILKHKLILQLNETDSRQGFAFKDALKDQITKTQVRINEKNMKPYTIKNYARIFIFTNNMNPIDISQSDRRYCVFQASSIKPNTEYFNKLYSILDNNDALYTLFEYLSTIDISNFNIRERPITKAYTEMKERNIHPFNQFLHNIVVEQQMDKYFKKNTYKIHTTTKNILATSSDILSAYEKYTRKNKIKSEELHYKRLKSLLAAVSVHQKNFKIKGESQRNYEFKIDELKPILQKIVDTQGDEEIELNDNEWESGAGLEDETEHFGFF